jgi:alkylmercury lyase
MAGVAFDRLSETALALLPSLSVDDRRFGLALYRALLTANPASIDAVGRRLEMTPAQTVQRLEGPGLRSLVLYGESDRTTVVGFAGLAVTAMRHRFIVGGRTLYTWCAWDGLFLPGLLSVTAEVVSRCPDTGDNIRLRVGPGGIERVSHPEVVVSFPTSGQCCSSAAETRASFCDHVFFLASRAAADRWPAGQAGSVVLSLDQAFELGRRRNVALFREGGTHS